MIKNKQIPFWFIAFAFLTGLTLPTLIQDGMFMDAMLYTSVSHNLSIGIGTFWFPQFSIHNIAGLSSFHEQPPLVFGIQALFFKLLGDSLYVERLYTFLTLCITAWLINILWKNIFTGNKQIKEMGWLPVILWITVPVCFWSYSNNMHENTMGIFTLLAVFYGFIACKRENNVVALLLSGLFIFLASLSKGLPGLFPIAVPILYWIVFKKGNLIDTIKKTLVIIIVPSIIYGVLMSFPESRESLSLYFLKRAVHRINEVPTVDNHFYILLRLIMELIPQILLTIIIVLIAKIKKTTPPHSVYYKEVIFFLLTGLTSSAPLMLTLVQKGFYFIPALPYFAIGLAIFMTPAIASWIEKIDSGNKKYLLFFSSSILILASVIIFSFMQAGKFSRNKELLHDVYAFGKIIPQHTVVSVDNNLWNDWDLQCSLVRYFNISLETSFDREYFLSPKNSTLPDTLKEFEKINVETLQYDLYKKAINHISKGNI